MREIMVFVALFGVPCATILLEAVRDGSRFALHPAANTVATLICMPSALYVMLERKKMTSNRSRTRATQLHLALHSVALVLLAIGGIAVFQVKQTNKHVHLSTSHSWAGAILMLLAMLNLLQGVMLTVEKQPANWQWKDETHVFVGALAYILSALTTAFGLYTGSWGHERLGAQQQMHLAILISLAHIVLLGKVVVISRKRQPLIKQA